MLGSLVSSLIVSPLDSSVNGMPILNAFCFKNCFCLLLYSILFNIFAISHITLNKVVFPVAGPPTIMIPVLPSAYTASYNCINRMINRSDVARPLSESLVSTISFILNNTSLLVLLESYEECFDT